MAFELKFDKDKFDAFVAHQRAESERQQREEDAEQQETDPCGNTSPSSPDCALAFLPATILL